MSLSINSSGVNHARQLVKSKEIESAKTWNLSRKERKALKPSMFLAKDDDTGELKFPFGKENKVYRSGLIAAKRRAVQYGYSNIVEEVDGLLKSWPEDQKDLFLYGVVGQEIQAKNVIDEAKALKDFSLRVNSPGGSVMEGYAIYNYFTGKGIRPKVYVDGFCGSIATVIACCGEVVMPENAIYMIHNPSSFVWGEKKDMLKEADVLAKIEEGIVSIYRHKSGLSEDKIKEMMDDETWLSAKEAKALGFCDEVSSPVDATMKFDLEKYFSKVPENLKRRHNVVKDFLMKKAKAIGLDVEDTIDEQALMAKITEHYEVRVASLEVAAAVTSLEARVGKDFAVMLGKISGKVETETFDALVKKIEDLQKLVDDAGERKSEKSDFDPETPTDEIIMKKAAEIEKELGVSSGDALVELAKREPELMANWV
jgi:ATP-dependent protease ClpP protease subunit